MASGESNWNLAGTRALLVEDNDLLRKSMTQTLKHLGCHVTAIGGGTDARRLVAEGGPIDVILSDVRMPDVFDGIQLVQWIREQRPDIAVILMSGYHNQTVDPSICFLAKPFTLDQLRSAICRALEHPQRDHPG